MLRELIRDQEGQALIEFMMLLIISITMGFLILIAMGQVVNSLYGKLEGEVSRPSHF